MTNVKIISWDEAEKAMNRIMIETQDRDYNNFRNFHQEIAAVPAKKDATSNTDMDAGIDYDEV